MLFLAVCCMFTLDQLLYKPYHSYEQKLKVQYVNRNRLSYHIHGVCVFIPKSNFSVMFPCLSCIACVVRETAGLLKVADVALGQLNGSSFVASRGC